MSMEIYVLSEWRLRWMAQWQSAIDAQAFPLRLSDARPFVDLCGALPVTYRDRPAGFECDHWSADRLMAETPHAAFERPWRYAVAFRCGGDIDAAASAYLAAAAYATATSGRILACAEGKLISPDRAVEIARELEQHRHSIEEAVRRAVEGFRTG